MTRTWRAALTALLCGAAALAAPAAPGAVRVYFGDLAWVYARGGLPTLTGGRVTVPVAEACALLGARCVLSADGSVSVTASGRTATVPGRAGTVELRSLSAAAGAAVTWNGAAGAAVVTAVPEGSGVEQLREVVNLQDAAAPQALTVRVTSGAGSSDTLTVEASTETLRGLTLVSRLRSGGLTASGEAVPSTPDVPNAARSCDPAGRRCDVGLDRDTLYALAALSRTAR